MSDHHPEPLVVGEPTTGKSPLLLAYASQQAERGKEPLFIGFEDEAPGERLRPR